MRMTLISTIIILVGAMLICAVSLIYVCNTVGEVERMRIETVDFVQQGNLLAARERITQLASHWEHGSRLLKVLVAHDDVHEVASHILDAKMCLEVTDIDDFLRVCEQMGAALEHIRSVETLSMTNLY